MRYLIIALLIIASVAAATPDIVSNLSFETSWDGLVNGGYQDPTLPQTYRDTTHAVDGIYSIKRVLSQTAWRIVNFTNSNPTVVYCPGANFTDGQQIGIYNTPDPSLNLNYELNSRYAKRIDADHFAVYSDSGLTMSVGSLGGVGGTIGLSDIGGAVHLPFHYGSPAWAYTPNPPIPAQTHDRLWSRFYFYFDNPPMNGTLKFYLYFSAAGQQMGGLYVFGTDLAWFFVDWYNYTPSATIAPLSSLKGGWHSVEVEYWRAGHPSGYSAVRIWLDDNLVSWPSIPTSRPATGWPAYKDNNSYLIAGYRANSDAGGAEAGSPGVFPGLTTQIGDVYWAGTLNGGGTGNFQTSNVWYEKISMSSLGRIGPDAPTDATPPIIISTGPSGTVASTNSVNLQVQTNEPATCKYSQGFNPFSSMTAMQTTGGTTHSTPFSVTPGEPYKLYVLCNDTAGNLQTTYTTIGFSVASTGLPNLTGEPVFNLSKGDAPLWTDSFDTYPNITYMSTDLDNPWRVAGYPYTGASGSMSLVSPGHGGSGQAVRGTVYQSGFNLIGYYPYNNSAGFYQTGFNIGAPASTYIPPPINGGYTLVNLGYNASPRNPGSAGHPYNSTQQTLVVQVWFRLSKGARLFGTKGIELWDTGGPPYGSGRIQTGWQIGGEYLNILDTPSDGPGTVINHENQPVPPYWEDLNDGNWHRWTVESRRNSVYAGGLGYNSSRDGFSRAWIDGIKVMDYSASAVGVTPPGATRPWATWDDVDQIGARLHNNVLFPSVIFGPLTDNMTWDWDDLQVWVEGNSTQPDTIPPIVSNGSPTGTLSSGTTSTTLSITTDETSSCRYSTTPNTAYSSMINSFTDAGTSHTTTINGLANGQSYSYYVRCNDTSGNADTSDYSLSFSVASAQTSTVLFQENFEDTNFAARGWYDGQQLAITSNQSVLGSTASFEMHFTQGAITPVNARGGRHVMNATDSVYLSYWVKYSNNWVGSMKPYHPHDFSFVTTDDWAYVGPAFTNLTIYVEENYVNGVGNAVVTASQDGRNIDQSRINLELTNITENRSVSGCNGNSDGYTPTSDCYFDGTEYNNGKGWKSGVVMTDASGPSNKNNWHFVEAYYKLNSIQNGIGQLDGVVQEWVDGSIVTNHTNVLFRTGMHPTMKFNQFLLLPYIGDGSPVDQYMWIDNITVATSRPGTYTAPATGPGDLNGDGRVDFLDLLIVINDFRRSGAAITNTRADINGDGTVNLFDFVLLAKNWGRTY